jgi:hypothetical protein
VSSQLLGEIPDIEDVVLDQDAQPLTLVHEFHGQLYLGLETMSNSPPAPVLEVLPEAQGVVLLPVQ